MFFQKNNSKPTNVVEMHYAHTLFQSKIDHTKSLNPINLSILYANII